MRGTSEKDNLEQGVFCGVGSGITYAKALRREGAWREGEGKLKRGHVSGVEGRGPWKLET